MTRMRPPPVSASLEASISWDPHLRTGNPEPAGVTVGPLYLDAVLSYNNGVHYVVELGLGRDGRPGVQSAGDDQEPAGAR